MKQLNSEAGVFGPFAEIETLDDRYLCDGVDYQFCVLGATAIEDYADPSPTLPQITVADYTTALEAMYDARAAERHYDSRFTCALRAGYAGPFHAEGTAFGTWMDTCNAQAYTTMAEVLGGQRAYPSIAELLASMPALVWP